MHLMFGNTYLCESTFSIIKQVKSKNRNQMADKTLDDSVEEATTTGTPLIEICNKLLFAIV